MGVLDDEADLLEEGLKAEASLLEGLGGVVTLLHNADGLGGQSVSLDGQESSCCLYGVCNKGSS